MVFDAVARHQKGILSLKSFKDIIGSEPVFPGEKESLSRVEAADLVNLFNGRFPRLKEVEQVLISEALKIAANNQGIAASLLGISRNALNKRLVRAEKKKAR